MEKVRILLEREPKTYEECPFSDFCGWACRAHEDGECKAFDDYDPTYESEDVPQKFNFSKCPCCKAIN